MMLELPDMSPLNASRDGRESSFMGDDSFRCRLECYYNDKVDEKPTEENP